MSELKGYDVQQIADEIECYLKNHPNAADTINGITKWWLPGQGIEVSSVIVQKALNYLCSKLIVKCSTNLNGNKIYSSNKTKAEDQSE